MAVINVTDGTKAKLTLGTTFEEAIPGAAGGLDILLIQDITISTTPGTVRYSTLDSPSSSAFTTVTENSVSLNILVDDDIFFGVTTGGVNDISDNGLFTTSNEKTEVYFSVAFEGIDTGSKFIWGKGFIGGLAPSASIDQAVWITPMEIIVNGELAQSVVPAP